MSKQYSTSVSMTETSWWRYDYDGLKLLRVTLETMGRRLFGTRGGGF